MKHIFLYSMHRGKWEHKHLPPSPPSHIHTHTESTHRGVNQHLLNTELSPERCWQGQISHEMGEVGSIPKAPVPNANMLEAFLCTFFVSPGPLIAFSRKKPKQLARSWNQCMQADSDSQQTWRHQSVPAVRPCPFPAEQ